MVKMRCSLSPPFPGARGVWPPQRVLRGSLMPDYTCPRKKRSRVVRDYSSDPSQQATKDHRSRLTQLWVPTGGIAASSDEDAHSKLIRAGFLRQAHPGIFHMLPLGRRVQGKLEALIDKYMYQLGASKLSLSSISSEELWSRSGRLATGSELFRFGDRKDVKYLLSPTHEEEITSLVSNTVKSYRELPVRLFQISRKYRDELRPRHGLLRSREFVMKDLYTFDYSSPRALATYQQVKEAYARLFNELKLPYVVAEADSGDMGGNLSHEFHFPTSMGEDHIISCSSCDYAANEELAERPAFSASARVGNESQSIDNLQVWRGISRNRRTLINVWYLSSGGSDKVKIPDGPSVNIHAVKSIWPDLDPSVNDPLLFWGSTPSSKRGKEASCQPTPRRLINLVDCRLSEATRQSINPSNSQLQFWPVSLGKIPKDVEVEILYHNPSTQQPMDLLRIKEGEPCHRCSDGRLHVQRAIELGHTFHLGTRYSEPLSANVTVPVDVLKLEERDDRSATLDDTHSVQQVPMQMGCHGIGVSRMIGAVADTLADTKGLNWPRVMAPFEAVIIPGKGRDEDALEVYDTVCAAANTTRDLEIDLILDDRPESFAWKMRDADLVGYPVIVVVGRRYDAKKVCEVQCRQLNIRQEVSLGDLQDNIKSLLAQL